MPLTCQAKPKETVSMVLGMIVQPDFPEHWKTRLLVEITGDESAPMAVLRLWAHCQHSKRSFFPDMTRTQLASICHWGNRKPPCHIALTKAGYVDKLKPHGFAAHQWDEHNAQLLQRWEAGRKGGRPPTEVRIENENSSKTVEDSQTAIPESETQTDGKTGESEKPTDNRPITGTKPDQIRLDQIRSEKRGKAPPDLSSKDLKRLDEQIKEEQQKGSPDRELLKGLKAQREEVREHIRALGRNSNDVAPAAVPKPKPQPIAAGNSFADTPVEKVQRFVAASNAAIDAPPS